MTSIIKRHSLLRRHPRLTRQAFFDHYLDVHGPLAAAQAGFRKFAYRYVQNHIDAELLGGEAPPFDGITMTYQTPRRDYRTGFFQHPDYANVRPDEEHLFDLSATVSVLGEERPVLERAEGRQKAVIILRRGDSSVLADGRALGAWSGVRRVLVNDLDVTSASALGFGGASFAYDQLWEIWFDTADDRLAACSDPRFHQALDTPSPPLAFSVQEFTIFAQPRPIGPKA
jgi:hypothetical protein